MEVKVDYIASGGNLNPQAADWHEKYDVLAFGSGHNIALWRFNDDPGVGVFSLLKAHDAVINAVRFAPTGTQDSLLLSGSADGRLCVWRPDVQASKVRGFKECYRETAHKASITCLAVAPHLHRRFMTGSADGTIGLHTLVLADDDIHISRSQTIEPRKALIPLAIAIYQTEKNDLVVAIGGTRSEVWLYGSGSDGMLTAQATLNGHEGWIRDLAFSDSYTGHFAANIQGHVILASASQDKNVRLWRLDIQKGSRVEVKLAQPSANEYHSSMLSNKQHQVHAGGYLFSATFEALLMGHDDWIYSARWSPDATKMQILTASADNSVSVWTRDGQSGVWYSDHRLGDLSIQKGSTSATGSMGGLWNGIWASAGSNILALGRTGSWYRWTRSHDGTWMPNLGVSGHCKPVRGLSWARSGAFLLTSSTDQTTRLHAEWLHNDGGSWHEFSRPQIHGYDLNCIGAIGDDAFVSGAEEKLLRVFERPDDITNLLRDLCRVRLTQAKRVPRAGIPVLGLSNKSEELAARDPGDQDYSTADNTHDKQEPLHIQGLEIPPLENVLSKSTLWPEREKLYGHGFEISTLAVSFDGSFIATSCKASSLEHAVIRIFSTPNWRQSGPPLRIHTLTVTGLSFSPHNNILLSIGRDRQWATWKASQADKSVFDLDQNKGKAHSRMILSAAWLVDTSIATTFATGGREKVIKLWSNETESISCKQSIDTDAPIISLAAYNANISEEILLAAGFETGSIEVYHFEHISNSLHSILRIPDIYAPSASVTVLAWRPESFNNSNISDARKQLAISSEDGSVRVLSLLGSG